MELLTFFLIIIVGSTFILITHSLEHNISLLMSYRKIKKPMFLTVIGAGVLWLLITIPSNLLVERRCKETIDSAINNVPGRLHLSKGVGNIELTDGKKYKFIVKDDNDPRLRKFRDSDLVFSKLAHSDSIYITDGKTLFVCPIYSHKTFYGLSPL